MSDGTPEIEPADEEACLPQSALLSRIEALEADVKYLKNKPAQYVPPPTFGPLPRSQPYPLEIGPFKGMGADEAEEFKKQLRDLVNSER